MLQLQSGKMISEHYYTAGNMRDANVENHTLPLTVNCCGRVARILPFTTDVPMGRNDYYLMYMLCGTLQGRFADTEGALAAGSFVCISPHTPYRYSNIGAGEIHYLAIHFTGKDAAEILEHAGIQVNTVYFPGIAPKTLELFEALFSVFRKIPDNFTFLVDAHMRCILGYLCADAKVASVASGKNLDTSLIYIHSHLNTSVSVDLLAAMEYLSPSRYRAVFKQLKGCSPQAYITRQKIRHACSLLADGHLDIREISERCGYSDRLYFQRIFKKETGVTPAAYRKQARGETLSE